MEVAHTGGEQARTTIARLWLSEGIPFAFKDQPGLYETVRTWLGIFLDVHPKEISLIGSARIGQSLAPNKLGKPFNDYSDLDLFVVSQDLFNKMKEDFKAWAYQFESDKEQCNHDNLKKYWPDNYHQGLKNIQRGFLDAQKIPNDKDYPTIKNINNYMWMFKEKLDITEGAPKIKKASMRCYQDWDSFVRQATLNLS
ncbi:MAG: hypothetical protein HAW67_07635 [Endozoicomonadaceae bacterium]|nr:hypothetical protein [Endozoicomonadaceae bacterium]